MNEITNFEQWVTAKAKHGWIDAIGNLHDGHDIVISDAVLDEAFRWLASRYDPKSGRQCTDFVIDEIMGEATDQYAARLLVQILTETDPAIVVAAARELRHHYARRKIEYFSDEVVRMVSPSGPDPLDKRKNEIESGLEG